MAIIKVKPTSPGRRGLQKVVLKVFTKESLSLLFLKRRVKMQAVIIMEGLLFATKVAGTNNIFV
jgi:hypothetical protein